MLPLTPPALMSAHRDDVEVVRFSSVNPRLLKNESLNVWCFVNASVLFPIQTEMSLSVVTASR